MAHLHTGATTFTQPYWMKLMHSAWLNKSWASASPAVNICVEGRSALSHRAVVDTVCIIHDGQPESWL